MSSVTTSSLPTTCWLSARRLRARLTEGWITIRTRSARSDAEQRALDDEAEEEDERPRRENQREPQVCLALPVVHDSRRRSGRYAGARRVARCPVAEDLGARGVQPRRCLEGVERRRRRQFPFQPFGAFPRLLRCRCP